MLHKLVCVTNGCNLRFCSISAINKRENTCDKLNRFFPTPRTELSCPIHKSETLPITRLSETSRFTRR